MMVSGARHRLSLGVVIMTLAVSPTAISQVAASLDAPAATVRQFKASLDQNNLSSMCSLMAESDRSGPLTTLHFEKMQSSMSELVKLWQYTAFSYGGTTIDDNRKPTVATVHVTASQLKQEVRFTLLRFTTGWYISDIEIYFK